MCKLLQLQCPETFASASQTRSAEFAVKWMRQTHLEKRSLCGTEQTGTQKPPKTLCWSLRSELLWRLYVDTWQKQEAIRGTDQNTHMWLRDLHWLVEADAAASAHVARQTLHAGEILDVNMTDPKTRERSASGRRLGRRTQAAQQLDSFQETFTIYVF